MGFAPGPSNPSVNRDGPLRFRVCVGIPQGLASQALKAADGQHPHRGVVTVEHRDEFRDAGPVFAADDFRGGEGPLDGVG